VNSTAVVIGVAYGCVVVVATLAALAIARTARHPGEADHRKLARRENVWFFVVLALLTALLGATIFLTPYDDGEAAVAGRQVVEVNGQQFAWVVEPATVRAGRQVEFRIRASDVNHGFGLYDPDDHLVFQVQAIPDELQKEYHTLRKPGRYRIICLEFCGVGHHQMLGQLTVTR
jgi:cytochrome c oxidase subunit 2